MAVNFIQSKNKFSFGRREMLIGFSAALALFVSFVFPKKTFGEVFWLSLLLFAIFPLIVVYFLLEEPLENFGLSCKLKKWGLVLSAVLIIAFIFLNYYLVFHSPFRNQIFVAHGISSGFFSFLFFEIFLMLPTHFFWEIFYRGFIQLGLEKKLGIYSLAAAAALQTLSSFRGSWVVIVLTILSSLSAGLIVRQSRSIFYSAISLWIISVSLDIILIRLINSGSI